MDSNISQILATKEFRDLPNDALKAVKLWIKFSYEEGLSKKSIENFFHFSYKQIQRYIWKHINGFNVLEEHGNKLLNVNEEKELVDEIQKRQLSHDCMSMHDVISKVPINKEIF